MKSKARSMKTHGDSNRTPNAHVLQHASRHPGAKLVSCVQAHNGTECANMYGCPFARSIRSTFEIAGLAMQ